MRDRYDIVVAGGGPAGCTAAIGLARAGHTVAVVTSARPQASVEGLSERVLRALEAAGCAEALGAIGPAVRREVSWNGETSAANREWVVERAGFDRALLADAAAHGVDLSKRHIRGIGRDTDGWRLAGVAGRFLVEARGRRAPGRQVRGPASTALAQSWTGIPGRARSAVATFDDGWAWFATTGDGRGTVQLVLSSAAVPGREVLPAFVDAELACIEATSDWLAGGHPDGPISARHAAMNRAVAPIDEGCIRIGDAALALDPLSGHGVFEAIASATAAVPVVNTLLGCLENADLARSFYEDRIREAHLRFARIGRDFYRLERRFADRPFWRERAAWPDDAPAYAAPGASAPVVAERPVAADGVIRTRRVIVTADHPRGVWQVRGVPLVELLERATDNRDPGILAGQLNLEEASVETALEWLRYRRLLD